jgi:integrase/recombinase XerD
MRGSRMPLRTTVMLPRLSTCLGHVKPKDTYWYLSAAPELLALAGERLERHLNTGDAA